MEILVRLGIIRLLTLLAAISAGVVASASPVTTQFAVGPQYDSTHAYMSADDLPRFVRAFAATFGGAFSAPATVTVTPTPSKALWSFVRTPVGPVSAFGFTPPEFRGPLAVSAPAIW